jgi:hypothetical protein
MGERMGQMGRMGTDFLFYFLKNVFKIKKIRSHPPNLLHPFSHYIGIFPYNSKTNI